MKKTLLTLAFGLAMALTAANAQAVTLAIDDAQYIGSVDPGSPADADMEVYYINFLLDMTADTQDTDNPLPDPPNTVYSFDRSAVECTALGGCVDATADGADANNNVPGADITDFDVSGFTYLLAKYGNTSYVWYVGDLDTVTLNSVLGGGEENGLSHYSLYNPGTVTTPDGGTTLSLLGLAMLGLGYLRRHMA